MDWFRWYHGTVNDPKFRLVAKRANVAVHQVIAVWAAALERASQNTPRGTIEGWDDEVVAEALEMEPNAIERIRTQANGKLFDGVKVIGWDRRQPKREDGSADRAKRWRETQKQEANANERTRTQTNTDKSRVEYINTPHSPPKGGKRGSKIPSDWIPNDHAKAIASEEGYSDGELDRLAKGFREYWSGTGKTKIDWDQTFYNHLRSSMAHKDVWSWRKNGLTGEGDTPAHNRTYSTWTDDDKRGAAKTILAVGDIYRTRYMPGDVEKLKSEGYLIDNRELVDGLPDCVRRA